MTAASKDYEITRGATFSRTLRWGLASMVYKPISAVALAAPCVLTVPQHGLTTGWLFTVENAQGMTALNGGPYQATVLDPDTVQISNLDASAFRPYKAGGVLAYHAPVDLTGMTARLSIRRRLTDAVPALELTTADGGIVIDAVAQTLTFTLTPAQTTALAAAGPHAVYALFVTDASGAIIPVLRGDICIITEAVQ